jgi:hypothetical protein
VKLHVVETGHVAPYLDGYYDDYAYGPDCWYSSVHHRWVCPAY